MSDLDHGSSAGFAEKYIQRYEEIKGDDAKAQFVEGVNRLNRALEGGKYTRAGSNIAANNEECVRIANLEGVQMSIIGAGVELKDEGDSSLNLTIGRSALLRCTLLALDGRLPEITDSYMSDARILGSTVSSSTVYYATLTGSTITNSEVASADVTRSSVLSLSRVNSSANYEITKHSVITDCKLSDGTTVYRTDLTRVMSNNTRFGSSNGGSASPNIWIPGGSLHDLIFLSGSEVTRAYGGGNPENTLTLGGNLPNVEIAFSVTSGQQAQPIILKRK